MTLSCCYLLVSVYPVTSFGQVQNVPTDSTDKGNTVSILFYGMCAFLIRFVHVRNAYVICMCPVFVW